MGAVDPETYARDTAEVASGGTLFVEREQATRCYDRSGWKLDSYRMRTRYRLKGVLPKAILSWDTVRT